MFQQESNNSTTTIKATGNEIKFCRLCLEETDLIANLFDADPNGASDSNSLLSQKLFELFQIKYEETPSLPNSICGKCFEMIESFSVFRENVHKIESALQKRVAILKYGVGRGDGVLKVMEEPPREGLNGHPGVFVPEENAVVIEVDPDLDYESSEDDFSIDSDSDSESESISGNKKMEVGTVSNKQIETLSTSFADPGAMDVELSDQLKQTQINKVNETTILIKSNIVEKSYSLEGAPTKITYSCQYCDITYEEKKDCEEHVFRHNPAAPFICSFCSLEFIDHPELITHVRESHDSERPYICATCKKGFLRRSDLRKHTIVHTGIRPFTCSICGKNFSRNTNLTKHSRIHKGIRPHICIRCPRSFATVTELARHTRTHNLSKLFRCMQCNASFAQKDQLIEHNQVHFRNDKEFLKNPSEDVERNTAIRKPVDALFKQPHHHQQKYQAQQYEMDSTEAFDINPGAAGQNSFNAPLSLSSAEPTSRNSILAAQLQQICTTVIEKPSLTPTPSKQSQFTRLFACEICSQTFSRKRDYQRHQALHLDTLFSCKQCGMIFSRREKLARHELEQHAPQYPCNICRIPFTKHSDYELHMRMHELQQSVTATAQAASLLSSGGVIPGYGFNNQNQQHQQQTPTMLPPPTKVFRTIQQRPSVADMNFFSQMLPTMNLGFYSEMRKDNRSEF